MSKNSLNHDEEATPLIDIATQTVDYETANVNGKTVIVNKFKFEPDLVDDESFIDNQTAQKKEYSSETPRIPQAHTAFKLGVWANIFFVAYLIFISLLMLAICHFYKHPETRGKFIVLVWLVTGAFFSSILITIRLLMPEFFVALNRSIVSDIITALATTIAGIGFFFYLNGNITAQDMVYFFLVPVLVCIADFVAIVLKPGYTSMANAIPLFFSAVQNLVFALNIAYFHSDEWSLILILYLIAVIIMVIYSSLLVVITIVAFFVWLLKLRQLFDDYVISLFVMSYMVFLSGIGFLVLFLFIGFRRLLENHSIFVEHPQTKNMDQFLYKTALAGLIFFGVIILWNLLLFFPVYRKIRTKYMLKVVHRQQVIYKEKLLMKVKLVSKDYFRKESDVVAGTVTEKLDKCFVCVTRDANCVLYPCGHTGFCMECVREDQTNRDACMTCKQKIVKAKRITFNEEDGVYYSTMEERYA